MHGAAWRGFASKRTAPVRFSASAHLALSNVIYGHCLAILPLTFNRTTKWVIFFAHLNAEIILVVVVVVVVV